jgi:hypothetical protein
MVVVEHREARAPAWRGLPTVLLGFDDLSAHPAPLLTLQARPERAVDECAEPPRGHHDSNDEGGGPGQEGCHAQRNARRPQSRDAKPEPDVPRGTRSSRNKCTGCERDNTPSSVAQVSAFALANDAHAATPRTPRTVSEP